MLNLAPHFDPIAFNGEVFIHSPCDEPLELSVARLEAAVRFDDKRVFHMEDKEAGVPLMFTPLNVYFAYLHHKSLGRNYKEVLAERDEKRRIKRNARN